MKNNFLTKKLSLACALLFLNGAVSARPLDIGKIPDLNFTPPQPEKKTLSNGVTVFILEDKELPIINLSLRMKTSPSLEDPKKPGSMGFLGSLWRSGGTQSQSPDELDLALEYLPASVETSANEETASVSMSCLAKDFDATFDIFTDVLFNPAFDSKKLKLQKDSSIEGLKAKNETPASIGRRAFRDVLYGDQHLYARNLTEPKVKKINRKDLVRLHERVLSPEGAVLAVSGYFDQADMLARLEEAFRGWTEKKREPDPYDYEIEDAKEGALFLIQKDFEQSRIYIGALGISRLDEDEFILEVGDYILGGSGPSRLFGEVRSRLGLAYVVGSFFTKPKGPGLIGVGSQTKAESTVKTIQALNGVIDDFLKNPPTSDELALAKDALLNSFIFSFHDIGQIVSQEASLFMLGYPDDYLETYPDSIRSVTSKEIQRAYKKYLSPEERKTVVVGEPSKFDASLDTVGPVTKIPLEEIE